jgi:hypothetical protein
MAPVYIDNLVEMIQLAAQSDKVPGQAYNGMDDGKLVWSCRMEELNKFGAFVQTVPKSS